MTNRKNTKRALFASVISMLLCVTMLVGSTFAWFTDNASTAVNSIQSGTLKIGLYTNEACTETAEGKTLSFTKGGDNVLWEPGATWTLPTVYIKNEGTLAVKYKVEITGINGDAKLNEVINWTISDGTTEGTGHLTAGQTQAITISGTMQTTAGNDYQGLTIDGIGITVRATQDTVEYDSDDNQYDAGAAYQEPLADADDLLALFHDAATGGSGTVTINLDQDFDGTGWTPASLSNYNGVNTIVINGNGHTIYNLTNPLMIGTWGGAGTVTVNDLIIADADISASNYNGLGVGAIMAYCDASGGVTMTNCKVVNSKIAATGTDGCAGALMGYSSVSANFVNCEVSGCTISGSKYAGGIIGMTYGSNVSNAKVTNNTFDTATYKGVVSAHCLAGQSVFTNTTASGNNITDLCGRNTVAPTIN